MSRERDELAYDIAKAEYGWSREEWGNRDDRSPAKYYTLKYAGDLIAAGWRKLSLDDATVERVARAIFPSYWDDDAAECFETPEALAECQKGCTDHARAVLAAAVEAGQ